jgi:hypothetical protein
VKLVENDLSLSDQANIDPVAKTFCRDDSSRDREQKTFAVKHWIKKNTDFRVLFDQLGTAAPDNFFCNNLPKLSGYLNTSIPEGHVQRRSRFLPLGWYYRRKDWVLPYAYETIPGKPIIAGRTKGPADIGSVVPAVPASLAASAPEPATLGLLAMGSTALSTC